MVVILSNGFIFIIGVNGYLVSVIIKVFFEYGYRVCGIVCLVVKYE